MFYDNLPSHGQKCGSSVEVDPPWAAHSQSEASGQKKRCGCLEAPRAGPLTDCPFCVLLTWNHAWYKVPGASQVPKMLTKKHSEQALLRRTSSDALVSRHKPRASKGTPSKLPQRNETTTKLLCTTTCPDNGDILGIFWLVKCLGQGRSECLPRDKTNSMQQLPLQRRERPHVTDTLNVNSRLQKQAKCRQLQNQGMKLTQPLSLNQQSNSVKLLY